MSTVASTDLKGIAQTVSPFITVPVLRAEAIRASVARARDAVRAAEAMRRQAASDPTAQAVADVATVRDADRQLALYAGAVLPRGRLAVAVTRFP